MSIFRATIFWLVLRAARLFGRLRSFVSTFSGHVNNLEGERRRVRRRIYMRQGYLTFPIFPAYPPVECLVRDLSSGGAQIELSSSVEDHLLLGDIRLYLADANHEQHCKIVWRRDLLIGFKFEGPPVPASRDYSHPTQRGRRI